MKKQILLLCLVVTSAVVFAQPVSFGIRGGLSSSTIHGDAVKSLRNILDFTDGMITTHDRNSFFGGAYATIPLSKTISIEPALYYTQKGYELRGNLALKGMEFLNAQASAQLQSQYIDFPILFKVNVGELQLFAGPQISYLAKADLKTTAGVFGIDLLNRKFDVTPQFNKWDGSLTGGIGFTFGKKINVMASYDYGLSKVDANESFNAYNRGFKVGLGFKF